MTDLLRESDVDVSVTIDTDNPSVVISAKDDSADNNNNITTTNEEIILCVGQQVLLTLTQKDQLQVVACGVSKSVAASTHEVHYSKALQTPAKDFKATFYVPLRLTTCFDENCIKLKMSSDYCKQGRDIAKEHIVAIENQLLEHGHKEPYSAEATLFIKAGGQIEEVSLPDDDKIVHVFHNSRDADIVNPDDISKMEKIVSQNQGTVHCVNRSGYWGFLKFRKGLDANRALKYLNFWSLSFKKKATEKPVTIFTFKLNNTKVPADVCCWNVHLNSYHGNELNDMFKLNGKTFTIRKKKYADYLTVKSTNNKGVPIEKVVEYLKNTYNLKVSKVEENNVNPKNVRERNGVRGFPNGVRHFLRLTASDSNYKLKFDTHSTETLESSTVTVTVDNLEVVRGIERALQKSEERAILIQDIKCQNGKLSYTVDESHQCIIKRAIHPVVSGGLHVLRETLQEKHDGRIELQEEKKKNGDIKVVLTGDYTMNKGLRAAKTVLQNILSPAHVKTTQSHRPCMESPLGKTTIRNLEYEHNVKILMEGCKVKIYGHPGGKENSLKDLRPMIEDCMQRAISIDLLQFGDGRNVVGILQQKFGYHLNGLSRRIGSTVAIDSTTAFLYVKGYDARKRVLHILHYIHNDKKVIHNDRKMSELEVTCPICLSPIEGHCMTLGLCGHNYCWECLEAQIQEALTSRNIPILCAGDGCGKPILWQDLKMALRSKRDVLDQLIRIALDVYISSNADAFRSCPTAECDMFFYAGASGRSGENSDMTCSSCAKEICTVCGTPSHKGIPCMNNRLTMTDFPQDLKQWMKESADETRKMCPRCTHCIEKNGGCPHVVCAACQTNICWKCNLSFTNINDILKHFQAYLHC